MSYETETPTHATFFCKECGAECPSHTRLVRWNPQSYRGWSDNICKDCADAWKPYLSQSNAVDTPDNYYAQQNICLEETRALPTFKYPRA